MGDNWCHLSTFKFQVNSSWGSDDRSNNKQRGTEQASERGRETPSLDGIFRNPQLLCSLPGLQVIKSTNDCEPCKIWDESGVKQKGEESTDVCQISTSLPTHALALGYESSFTFGKKYTYLTVCCQGNNNVMSTSCLVSAAVSYYLQIATNISIWQK